MLIFCLRFQDFHQLALLPIDAFLNLLLGRNIYSPDHLHLFSDESAKIMMENANLEIISTWFFGQDAFELVGNVLSNGIFENHKLIDETYKIINDFQKIIDKNDLADTMLVLARKQ